MHILILHLETEGEIDDGEPIGIDWRTECERERQRDHVRMNSLRIPGDVNFFSHSQ